MRLLFDTNIPLDVLLERRPWHADAAALWEAVDQRRITAYLTTISVVNVHYIARRHAGSSAALRAVDVCLAAFELCIVDREAITLARTLPGNDFEDNVQIACAIRDQLDGIVTRDADGFRVSPVPVFTPAAALARLTQERR